MIFTSLILILLIFDIVLSFFFGLMVLIVGQGWKKLVNRRFFVFTISAVVWQIANLIMFININSPYDLFCTRATYLTGVFVAYFLLRFIIVFPKVYIQNLLLTRVINIFGLIITFFAGYLTFMPSTVTHVTYLNGSRSPQYGPLFSYFAIILIVLVILVSVFAIINYYRSNNQAKNKMRYMIIGIIITLFLVIFADIISPSFMGNNYLSNFDSFGLIFLFGFTFYAILAHRLFDIRVIIKRTLVYSVLLAFVLGVYATIIFSFAAIFGSESVTLSVKTIAPNIIAALLIAIGFGPLQKWLSNVTDRFLFKGEYNTEDTLSELSKILSAVLDLDEALQAINTILVREMRLHGATAFVLTKDPESGDTIVKSSQTIGYDGNFQFPNSNFQSNSKSQNPNDKKVIFHSVQNDDSNKLMKLKASEAKKLTLQPHDGLIDYYQNYINSQLSSQEHENIKTQEQKESNHELKNKKTISELPNAVKKEIKIDAEPVVTEELSRKAEELSGQNIFKATAAELKKIGGAVALPIIIKTHLVGLFVLGDKKSGDIYSDRDLQFLQVVANQTGAAIEKARFYEEDQLKSEFVSIASHELLTPTSAIEGYLSMILDEGMGKIDAQTKGYLEKVYASSKRLAHLVKDLLNVSRIEGGRIVVQSKNFDIKELINTVVEEIKPKAAQRKLELKTQGLDREVPQVWADPERVHQAIVNLAGNSIKYTEKGSVTIAVDFSISVVRVSVIDTGVGIPKDEIPHLFEKFYRASNADKTGAQGTGLGLYITKQIVELMGGIIQVDSELGKGSTFSFSLPKAKEEKQ